MQWLVTVTDTMDRKELVQKYLKAQADRHKK